MSKHPEMLGILVRDSLLASLLGDALAQLPWPAVRFAPASELLAYSGPWGALVLDVQCGDTSAHQIQEDPQARGCWLPTLIVSDVPLPGLVALSLVRNGCHQFLCSNMSMEQVCAALQELYTVSYLFGQCALQLATIQERIRSLLPKELQVAKLIAAGVMNKEVAAQTDQSLRTIEARRSAVFHKTGVKSIGDLAKWLAIADGTIISLEASEPLSPAVRSTVLQLLLQSTITASPTA